MLTCLTMAYTNKVDFCLGRNLQNNNNRQVESSTDSVTAMHAEENIPDTDAISLLTRSSRQSS
jgi:hypothetical protein